MTDAARVGVLVLVAALLQVSLFSAMDVAGGTPDVLLVTLVAIAFLRGSTAGAAAGFAAGLVVDVATLGTLGVTSLLLTVAGFWAGRYGETTGRDRAHAPALALVSITVLVGVAAYVLHFMLGEEISARHALVTTLLPAVVLNAVAGAAVWPLCVRLLPLRAAPLRTQEVELLV